MTYFSKLNDLQETLKLFDLSSTGLEITTASSFFENTLEFLKKKKSIVTLKILKISENSNG